MMRAALFAALIATLTLPCLAAQGKQVSYRSGDDVVSGMLYTPTGNGPFPALVVIHEWWGLNDWVKQQASKFADQGYETLAIDLYRGKMTENPSEARALKGSVPQERANRDLQAAFDYLKARQNVDPKRIGVIGWCMGGGYALDLALAQPKLAAAVINYGELTTERARLKKIKAPVLGIFGGQDRSIGVQNVHNFEQQMKRLGKKIDVVIYPEAGHAFENPNNKQGYREADTADAWRKTTAFLDAHLKKGLKHAQAPSDTHQDDYDDIELDDHTVPVRTTSVTTPFDRVYAGM